MPLEQLIAKLCVTPAPNEAAQEFQLDAYAAAKAALRARTRSAAKVEPSSKGSIMPQAIQSPDDRVAPQRDLNYGSKADITGCYRPSSWSHFSLALMAEADTQRQCLLTKRADRPLGDLRDLIYRCFCF
jgi:NAD(P)-dependent dehydrogenase (short-subunit alcohol dehydrogenase family)